MDTFEAIQKRYQESIALRRAELKEKAAAAELGKKGGPAERLSEGMSLGKEAEIKAARDRKPEAEKLAESQLKPQLAEQMKALADHSQRPPSPGGSNYVNPRVHKRAAPQSEATIQDRQAGEGLIDQLQRQRTAALSFVTSEQRQKEKQLNDELRRYMDHSNSRSR